MNNQIQAQIFPYKTVYDEKWDEEWSKDWRKLEELFVLIENIEANFNSFDVSILRELSQKKIILDLQKYAYSLSSWISNKYSR